MLVKEVMNINIKTIAPDSSVKAAAEKMSKFKVGGLIVVDKNRLVGIVTERDMLTKIVAKNADSAKTKVSRIMTREVIMIRPSADLEEACRLMKKHRIKKLPVLADNHLVGIITMSDIISAQPEMLKRLSELFIGAAKKHYMAG